MTQPAADYRQAAMPDGLVPCAKCKTLVDKNLADYSESGDLVCKRCSMSEQIDVGEGRVVSGLRSAAYVSLAATLGSFLFDPFLIVSISSLMGAASTLLFLWRNPTYRTKLGNHLIPVLVTASLATLIQVIKLGLVLLALTGVIATSAF